MTSLWHIEAVTRYKPSKANSRICTHTDQGAVSIRKTVLPGMAIPMLKIRRPNGRLIFNMEIAIPGKTVFLIETAPRPPYQTWVWIMQYAVDTGNVWQKLNLCLLRSHVHTKVTWSPRLLFMISFFNCAWYHSRTLTTSYQWRWQHVQLLHLHAIQNTRATIIVQSQQQTVKY